MKKLILTLFFLLGMFVADFSSSTLDLEFGEYSQVHIAYIQKYNEAKEIERKQAIYDSTFIETVEFIKKHEGFRDTAYYCLGGYKTIGYGFVVNYIDEQFKDSITREQADSIVVGKLEYYIKRSEKRYPHLNEFQHLSVAHMMYAKGEGTIIAHDIHKQLKGGYLRYNDIVYFGNFEKSKKSYAKHYKRSRIYEYNLFYKTYPEKNPEPCQKLAQQDC